MSNKIVTFFSFIIVVIIIILGGFGLYKIGLKVLEMKESATILIAMIALCGYGVKYYLDRQSELNRQKREVYLEFINMIMKTMRHKKTGETMMDEDGEINKNFAKELYDTMQKMILYAPAKICLAAKDFWVYIRSNSDNLDSKETLLKLSKIFQLMRKDIGLDVNGLGTSGENLLHFFITDIDEIMKIK